MELTRNFPLLVFFFPLYCFVFPGRFGRYSLSLSPRRVLTGLVKTFDRQNGHGWVAVSFFHFQVFIVIRRRDGISGWGSGRGREKFESRPIGKLPGPWVPGRSARRTCASQPLSFPSRI